ncbi:MAG TPA: hypothetical protein VFR07_03070 [Mycobacteriales bacterium]|jgi:ketosteroid isomerase-like protein|nr:hypothetical protein [Mycobacteriales bacterium]
MVDDVRVFFEGFAAAHAREDVEAYLGFFADDTVWVTSRGVCTAAGRSSAPTCAR